MGFVSIGIRSNTALGGNESDFEFMDENFIKYLENGNKDLENVDSINHLFHDNIEWNDEVEKTSVSITTMEDSSLTSNNQLAESQVTVQGNNHRTGPQEPFNYVVSLTEFQRFIAHEDFLMFLFLATKVKIIYKDLASETVPQPFALDKIQSANGEAKVNKTARFIQSLLVFDSHPALINNHSAALMSKGTCQSTDSIMTESINSLCNEFKRCMTWYDDMKMKSIPVIPAMKKQKTGKVQIAVKFPKWKQDILIDWMIANIVSTSCLCGW